MRRITAWITATVAVLALIGSYQLNAAGATGKSDDHQGTSTAVPNNETAKAGENN